MTPSEALAAYEAADARLKAAKAELAAAEGGWVGAAKSLSEAIEAALPDRGRPAVMIGGKLVLAHWDGDYWIVTVETPAVLG